MWKFVNSKYNTSYESNFIDEIFNDYFIELNKIMDVLIFTGTKLLPSQLDKLTEHLYVIRVRENKSTSNNTFILEKVTFEFTKKRLVNNRGKVVDSHTIQFITSQLVLKVENILSNSSNVKQSTKKPSNDSNSIKAYTFPVGSPNTKTPFNDNKNNSPSILPSIEDSVPSKSINLLDLHDNIKSLEKELEDKTNLCSEKLYEINVKKQEERRKKEKEEEKRRVFASDINTYKLIKTDITSGKLTGVPDIFVNKYKVLEVMEEEGVLEAEDNYDIFVDLYENIEVMEEKIDISEDLKEIFK